MFKSTIRVAFLCLAASVSANAQEIFKFNSSGGGFNFTVGSQSFDADPYLSPKSVMIDGEPDTYWDLTKATYDGPESIAGQSFNRSSTANFGKPKGSLITTGFQGYGVFSSIIMGGELNFGFGSITTGEQIDNLTSNSSQAGNARFISSNSSRFVLSDALFNVGLVAVRKRGFILYPMVGIGYGASGLWLKSESTTRLYPEATKVVYTGDRNLQNMIVWTRSVVLDFGLGAQYMLGASTEDKAKGFSLGIRAGYRFQPGTDDVKVNSNKNAVDSYDPKDFDGQATPLPKLGMSGLYVKLLIGFGKIGTD
jgi:hypothetical protein